MVEREREREKNGEIKKKEESKREVSKEDARGMDAGCWDTVAAQTN